MRLVRRAVTIAVVIAAPVLLLGGTVAAHAELLAVDPADGEVLDVAPADVTLTFSEPVSLTGGSVRVLDDAAEDVSTGTTLANETITTTLPDSLADGTYTVVFEVVSVDSHRISGVSVFHVGAPTSEGLVGKDLALSGDQAGWGVRAGAAALSTIGYLGALIAAGTLAFSIYADRRTSLRDVTSRAAVLGAVALVAAVPFRVARLGGGLDALRDNDVLMSALRGPIGVSTAITANALLLVAVLVDRRVARWLCLVLSVVALAAFSIEGHTRATQRRWVMVGSDVVHLCAAAVWLGGIVALVVMFRSAIDAGSLAGVVRRFSDSALLAVVVVTVTGVTMAWIILPTAGELTSTGYGLALLVKVALVLIVIGLGAYNRFRLVPAVENRERSVGAAAAGRPRSARRWLGTVVVAELVLLVAAVGVTAVMVTRSPLTSATSAAAAPTAPSTETVTVQLGDAATAEVTVSPGDVGANTVDLTLRDLEGRVINPHEAPVVELSVPALDVGPLRPEVVPLGIGRYEATADMGFAGTWDLTIRVRLDDFESVAGSTTVTIE
jgi:copper transport protein